MTLEEDIDYALFHFEGPGNRIAYDMLTRFDQVIEAVKKDEELNIFTIADFIPPYLKGVIEYYITENMDKEDVLKLLKHRKNKTKRIFEKYGYDATEYFEAEKKLEQQLDNQIKNYEDILKRIEIIEKELENK